MSCAIIPIPKVDVSVREATAEDLPFIDSLQKVHSKQVGFMPNAQLLGKIKAREVLVAVDEAGESVGYCIGTDRYFKRDDVGIIYHLNVAPGKQRGFVGATLLRAMFDRAAYGCKLFCCWCAQDIAANRFWEAMGFVPLAFRAGSAKKGRVHIFWQKRIRAGDHETPWWFPCQTNAGAIREDRIVLPIPPGTHWSDVKPMVLPGMPADEDAVKALPSPRKVKGARASASVAPRRSAIGRANTLHFTPPAPPPTAKEQKPKREKKPKVKNDPKLVAAVRELNARWMEEINSGAYVFEDAGKYDVTRQRQLSAAARSGEGAIALLPRPLAA